MSNKSKLVTGPLSNDDKVYIFESYILSNKSPEDIATKIKRNVKTVDTYLVKLSLKPPVITEPKVKADNFSTVETVGMKVVSKTGVATVFDGGETIPFKTNVRKNPFSTR